jgi:hypothetical protein
MLVQCCHSIQLYCIIKSAPACLRALTRWRLTYLARTMQLEWSAFIREKWPKSLSSYISQTKKQWITLDVTNESYASQYAAALSQVDAATEKETLRAARIKIVEFNGLNLAEKNTVQRRLRATQFSGHAMVDNLITSFAKFTSIHCMAFM